MPPASRGLRLVDTPIVRRGFGTNIDSVSEWFASMQPQLNGEEELSNPISENEIVYACSFIKSHAVGSVPIKVWQSEAEDAAEVPASDPIAKLFKRPDVCSAWPAHARRGVVNRIATGETWWFCADAQGKPVAVDSLGKIATPSQFVQVHGGHVEIEFDKRGMPVAYCYGTGDKGDEVKFPASAVISFFELEDPDDYFRGIGPCQVLARQLGVHFQAQRYIEGLTKNGGDAGGFLKHNGSLGADEIARLQAIADDEIGNPDNRGKYKVIGKDTEFIPNSVRPKDMEFGQLFNYDIERICGALGVPPELIGYGAHSTYANKAEAHRELWIGPAGVTVYLNSVAEKVNAEFFPRLKDERQAQYRISFDYSNVEALREDNTTKITAAGGFATQTGIPVDASLELYGVEHDPLPGGDMPIDGPDVPAQDVGTPAQMPTDLAVPAKPADGTLTGQDAQAQLPNGAQIASAVDIVAQVVAGKFPRDSGVQMLVTFFGLEQAVAESIMGSAGTETELTPNPSPAGATPPPDPNADPSAPPAKSFAHTRGSGPIADREKRIAHWNEGERLVKRPGDRKLKAAAVKFLRAYELAQIKRIRDFAEHGPSGKRFAKDISAESQLLDILTLNKQEWEDKMRALFNAPLRGIAEASLEHAASETGGISIGVGNPAVTEALIRREIRLAEGVTSTLAADVKAAIARVLPGDASIADLQNAIRETLPEVEDSVRGVFGSRDSRALRIARTESAGAAGTARIQQFTADGVTQIEWSSQEDDVVRESHQHVDGEVVALGTQFSNGLKWPHEDGAPAEEVINCYLPGTLVQGSFVAGSKAAYAGPAREIETARGERLRVTVNHPVLTSRGWIAAGDLREGDDLLGYCGDVASPVLRDVHDQHAPRAIEDIFDALAADGGVRPLVVRALDFHGDAEFFMREVDVPRADRVLRLESIEQREEFALVASDAVDAPSEGRSARAKRLDRVLRSTSSAPRLRALSEDGAAVALLARPLDVLRCGSAAWLNAALEKSEIERAARRVDRSGNGLGGLAGQVALDRIVKVRDFEFSGHVYDLQSLTGWMVADRTVSSNCRCDVIAVD